MHRQVHASVIDQWIRGGGGWLIGVWYGTHDLIRPKLLPVISDKTI